MDLLSVHRVIFRPVIELLFDSLADLNVIVGRDSDVSPVEQRVNILAEQNAIGRRMCTALSGVRPDVCRVQDMKDMGRRQRALATIGISHDHSERPLAETRQSDLRLTELLSRYED